jgi:hypothetical protein
MPAHLIDRDKRGSRFVTEAMVRENSEGGYILIVTTNEADYVPSTKYGTEPDPFVAQLHDLRVQVAESDPLVRKLADGILSGENKAKGEIVRVTRALSLAKEIAVQLYVSLEHVKEGWQLGLPSLKIPEDFEISCLMNVFDVYEEFAKAIRPKPGSGSEVQSKKSK